MTRLGFSWISKGLSSKCERILTSYFSWSYFRNEEKAAEAYLMQMSTPDLLRMLELLDMLESKETMKASERELATLQYLLKSYEK